MHKRFRALTVVLCGAILAACSSQQTVTPTTGTPPLGSMPSSAVNLVVDGIPVHALFPRGHGHRASRCKGCGANMIYHNGPIQKNPKIYVVYWGFTGSAADPQGVEAYEDSFVKGLSGNSYFDINTQYYSTAAGNITDPKGEYAGSWVDNATTPHQPSSSQIAAEGVRAAAHFGYNFDAVYVVQLPHGAFKNLGYCAYHSVTSSSSGDVHYADVPYQPDFPGCGTDSVNSGTQGQNDGTSETVAHEISETQTDPDTRTGWYDQYGNETGDYCSYINLQNVTLSTGTFATQPLWSNAANGCAISYP
jgi:hypothetical protein